MAIETTLGTVGWAMNEIIAASAESRPLSIVPLFYDWGMTKNKDST
jgi:hypothetical protein